MIANDQQLQTTLERIAWFQKQVAHLRRTETNPVNYRASVSGFLAEIDRMQFFRNSGAVGDGRGGNRRARCATPHLMR